MSHSSLGWYWRDILGSEFVSFVSGHLYSYSGGFHNYGVVYFSLFRMLQYLWLSSILSLISIFKYLICDNSPILIKSHSVNTTLQYGAGTAKWVLWLATGCKVRGSNSNRGNWCYIAQNCTDHGWSSQNQLFSGHDVSFLEVQQLCSLFAHSKPSSLEVNNEWSYTASATVKMYC